MSKELEGEVIGRRVRYIGYGIDITGVICKVRTTKYNTEEFTMLLDTPERGGSFWSNALNKRVWEVQRTRILWNGRKGMTLLDNE